MGCNATKGRDPQAPGRLLIHSDSCTVCDQPLYTTERVALFLRVTRTGALIQCVYCSVHRAAAPLGESNHVETLIIGDFVERLTPEQEAREYQLDLADATVISAPEHYFGTRSPSILN